MNSIFLFHQISRLKALISCSSNAWKQVDATVYFNSSYSRHVLPGRAAKFFGIVAGKLLSIFVKEVCFSFTPQ